MLLYQSKLWDFKKQNISKQERKQQQKKEEMILLKTIKGVDLQLDNINFDISIILKTFYIGLTSDRDDPLIPQQTLMEFEIENQNVSLWKQDFKCKLGVFGIKVSTLNTFEMLYLFANKLKKAATSYKNDLAVLTVYKNYQDFLTNIKKHIMRKEQQV